MRRVKRAIGRRVVRRTKAALRKVRPRRGAPDDTRARLVAAGAELFNRDGYFGTDSNRIAHTAGYAAGTFYKHFADKKEILLAAYAQWVSSEWEAIEREAETAAEPQDAARRIVDLVLAHHQRWKGLRASLSALLATDPEARRFHRDQRRRQLVLLAAMRERLGATPREPEDDAVMLFTLERTCDALATGEIRDLSLRTDRIRAQLEQLVALGLPRARRGRSR